jgi:hypothetical protein
MFISHSLLLVLPRQSATPLAFPAAPAPAALALPLLPGAHEPRSVAAPPPIRRRRLPMPVLAAPAPLALVAQRALC